MTSHSLRRVDYFYTTVQDQPGAAYDLLQQLSDLGINMLAFAAVPTGPSTTQLTIFPEDTRDLESEAAKAGLELWGPHQAFLAQGVDGPGALISVHERLYQAHVNVYASNGVANGDGSYGYIIYVRPDDYEKAAEALGL